MSEIINVDFKDLTSMSDDALGFFADELKSKNTIIVKNIDGSSSEIRTARDWDKFILTAGLRKPQKKKDVRI